MENPYESPRSESQQVVRRELFPQQWRLACWLMVFIAAPAFCSAAIMSLQLRRFGIFLGAAALLLSAVGQIAMLWRANCSTATKVLIFLLAIICTCIAATVGALGILYFLEFAFHIKVLPDPPVYPDMDD